MRGDRRLNPADCGFHAFECFLRQRGYAGPSTFMIMDLRGRLEPACVVQALHRAMQAHPSTAGVPARTLLGGVPVWRRTGAGLRAPYTFQDLSSRSDWQALAGRLLEQRWSAPLAAPPLIRLEHYRGPDDRERLCLRWPHALMDAEGARLFLSEMDRLARRPPPPPPDCLLPDDRPVDPLSGLPALERLGLLLRALREQAAELARRQPRPRAGWPGSIALRPAPRAGGARRGPGRLRCLHRIWSAGQVERLRVAAEGTTPAGPALQARYVAACVLRALRRLSCEQGAALPVYGLALPMRLPGLRRRPVRGNYLVSATLWVAAERLEDKRAALADISRQFRLYRAARRHLADWQLHGLVARMRFSHYCQLVRCRLRSEPALTGYSFYGEFEPPLRRFLGAPVSNVWGSGMIAIPPGWNPTFARFGERMNFALPWPEALYPARLVGRYAELIEQEVFGT